MKLPGYRAALSRNPDSIRFKWLSNDIPPLAYPLLLASICLYIVGCKDLKVKQPTSDSTSPSLVWNVFNQDTSNQADYPGSPTINVKRGEHYRITLTARDPEGVKSIQMNGGEMGWGCIDQSGGENVAQKKTASLSLSMTQNLSPDEDGMVLTRVILISNFNFTMECQPGFSFSSGVLTVNGQASNYFGGVTTEVIKFTVAP